MLLLLGQLYSQSRTRSQGQIDNIADFCVRYKIISISETYADVADNL